MLSPSLSLTFSSEVSIISRRFARAGAALHVLYGAAFASVCGCPRSESSNFFGLAHPWQDPSVFGTSRWAPF